MQKSFSAAVIHLLVVLLVIGLGGVICLASFLIDMQRVAIDTLLAYPYVIRWVGGSIFLAGCLLFSLFYQMHKGRYISIRMGAIDEKIVRKYVEIYWKGRFPGERVEVVVHGNGTIELIANAVIGSEMLSKVQSEVGQLLESRLGYRNEFFLTLEPVLLH